MGVKSIVCATTPLSAALDACADAVFLVDPQGCFRYVNQAACQSLGYQRDQLLTMAVLDIDPIISHDTIEHIVTTRSVYHFETCHRRQDGSTFPVEVSARFLEPGFGLCVVRDITDRKRIEETLRLLADSESGDDFLRTLARHLSATLGISHVIVSRWLQDGTLAETWLQYAGGVVLPNSGHPLADTPYPEIAANGICCYPSRVRERFPTDPILKEFGAESYAAAALRNSMGTAIGAIAVLGTTPFRDEAAVIRMLQIVAPRVAAELERVESDQRLRQQEQEFRSLAECSPDFIIRYDLEPRIRFINAKLARHLGITDPASVIGRRAGYVLPDGRYAPLEQAAIQAAQSGETVTLEIMSEGAWHHVQLVPERDLDGTVIGTLAFGRDITELKRIEQDLKRSEHQFRTLVEHSPDLIARYDVQCRRLYVNPAFVTALGGERESYIGTAPSDYPGGSYAMALEEKVKLVIATGESLEFELSWAMPAGKTITCLAHLTPEFDQQDQVESVLAVFRDITDLQMSREQLRHMAFYDCLTGLPNRVLLMDRLEHAITDAAWHRRKVCVMMIDLDRFKWVNDTLGHPAGDALLRESARRLTECVRSYDTVARLGGDEFVVILPEIRDGTDLGRIAGKILRALDRPFVHDNTELFTTGSIGIALYPDDGETSDDLMKYADAAMYSAKRSGRNNFRFYSRELTESANRHLLIENGLRHAIPRQELAIYFQPKISFETGMIIGSEALLRWTSAQLGEVPPDEFIPIAEDTGQIIDIGTWVLREACLAVQDWNQRGFAHKIAVNLSSRQFQARTLVETITNILTETGCDPHWLELEITETLLLDTDGYISDALSAFQAMGITIAVDDFGTGYSALSYLANFAIDTLKIDKSFIQAITIDRRRAELVKAILSIADCFGQQVVAEGVETYEQMAFLKHNNCHFAQGWYYSKAVPKDEMAQLLTC